MNKVELFQDRILTDAERLALATGAAMYRWEDPNKAPVNASMHLYICHPAARMKLFRPYAPAS